MKLRFGWLPIALAALCGCGGAAHQEALSLCKILANGHADFLAANAKETELMAATAAWADTIIRSGAGRGGQLEQNAKVAEDLANSADQVGTQVGQLRKAIFDLALQQEFTQGVRSTLTTQLTRRQRTLQELRTALTESAAQFRELSQTRSYKGDSYPTAIDKVNQMAQTAKPPEDVVGQALSALKDKYGIKDSDLVTPATAK